MAMTSSILATNAALPFGGIFQYFRRGGLSSFFLEGAVRSCGIHFGLTSVRPLFQPADVRSNAADPPAFPNRPVRSAALQKPHQKPLRAAAFPAACALMSLPTPLP